MYVLKQPITLGIKKIKILTAVFYNLMLISIIINLKTPLTFDFLSANPISLLYIIFGIFVILYSFGSIIKGGAVLDRFYRLSFVIIILLLAFIDYSIQDSTDIELKIARGDYYLSIALSFMTYLTILVYHNFRIDMFFPNMHYSNNLYNFVIYFLFINLYVFSNQNHLYLLIFYSMIFVLSALFLSAIEKLERVEIEQFLITNLTGNVPYINLRTIANISKYRILNQKYFEIIINNVESKLQRSLKYERDYKNFIVYNSDIPFSYSNSGSDLKQQFIFPTPEDIEMPKAMEFILSIFTVFLIFLSNFLLFAIFLNDISNLNLIGILIFCVSISSLNILFYLSYKTINSAISSISADTSTELRIYSNGLWLPNWMATFQNDNQIFLTFDNIKQIDITNAWENRDKFPDYEFRVEITAIDDTKFLYTGQKFGLDDSMDVSSMREIYESLLNVKSQLRV